MPGQTPRYTGTTTVNSGTLRLWNTSLWASNVTLNGGTLELQQTSVGTGTLAGAAIRTHASTIGGTGGTLRKTGDGTVILSGANTYQGATSIQAGTLQAGSTSAFGSNSAVTLANVAGATLNLNGFNNSIGSLAGGGAAGGNVILGAATLTTGGNNTSTSYAGIISGAGALTKTGSGTQTLTGANTYTGATTVSAGTLSVGNGGTTGLISNASPISVAGGATMAWNNNNDTTSNVTTNTLTGTGTVLFQGQNATTALQTSIYDNNGNWSGFSGEVVLNRSLLWNTTAQSQVGTGTIRVQDRGTMSFNGGTFSNNIVLESGAGWHHLVNGVDAVVGAIRLEGNNTLDRQRHAQWRCQSHHAGRLHRRQFHHRQLWRRHPNAQRRHQRPGRAGHEPIHLLQFRQSSSGQHRLAGTSSNTYTGTTVVDGQGGHGSLRLMKTGGAVAIAGNTIVQFGSATAGQANLRMGGNEQFGAGVVMNWVNAAGQWGRFDLKGTTQTIAGLNSTTATASMIVQNQGINELDPGADATLILNGSGTYASYGYVRDQDNGGTTRKLNIVKNGAGTQTLGNQAPGSIQLHRHHHRQFRHPRPRHHAFPSQRVALRRHRQCRRRVPHLGDSSQPGRGRRNHHAEWRHTESHDHCRQCVEGVDRRADHRRSRRHDQCQQHQHDQQQRILRRRHCRYGALTLNTTGGGNNGLVFRAGVGSYSGALQANSGNVFVNGTAGLVFQNSDVTLGSAATLRLDANWSGSVANASVKSLSGTGNVTLGAQTLTLGTNNGTGVHSGVISGPGADQDRHRTPRP